MFPLQNVGGVAKEKRYSYVLPELKVASGFKRLGFWNSTTTPECMRGPAGFAQDAVVDLLDAEAEGVPLPARRLAAGFEPRRNAPQ